MIKIDSNNMGRRGLYMKFNNGYTISIQFGDGTYSDNHNCEFDFEKINSNTPMFSKTVEIAVFGKDGEMVQLPNINDIVAGYQSIDELATWIKWTSEQ